MARVTLIAVVLAFLFIQLASSQDDACLTAVNTLTDNIAQCTPTADNPEIICDKPCRGYYLAIIDDCSAQV